MSKPGSEIPKSFLANPRTQLILFIFTVIYIISPIDFIPDAIPLLGWADDLAVLIGQLVSFVIYLKQKRKHFEDNEKGPDKNGS
jgi:uncharacterized membrane protein YkvA (DUF1232 family)